MGNPYKIGIHLRVRIRHKRPVLAIPVLDQPVRGSSILIVVGVRADSPDVVCVNRNDFRETAGARSYGRTVNNILL